MGDDLKGGALPPDRALGGQDHSEELVYSPSMAERKAMAITLNLDLEPTDKAREFVRQVVIEVLKEILASPSWQQDIEGVVDQALEKKLRQARSGPKVR